MTDYNSNWPTGGRDTTGLPTISIGLPTISIKEDIPKHLHGFLKLDQVPWRDHEMQKKIGDLNIGDTRVRTLRKMYERLGLLFQEKELICLSDIGKQIENYIKVVEETEKSLLKLRVSAINILSRYQLKNPCEKKSKVPDDCDVQPFVCIWKVMRHLDNKIHFEEVNRVLFHIMHMKDLDEAINTIQQARIDIENYSKVDETILDEKLGEPVIKEEDQPSRGVSYWLSLAGWGGIIIEPENREDGFRHFADDAIPLVDEVLNKPYPFYEARDEEDWIKYYIGSSLPLEPYRLSTGQNILLYGVPGSGKSWIIQHEYCTDENHVERLVFHPDYTYSDFVGQILPKVSEEQITYQFAPGPFTELLKKAYYHPTEEFFLVIEEINRGNAPAIFGDIFQLLDRKEEQSSIDDPFPVGTSEYGITNTDIAQEVYGDPNYKVRIPSNMSIIATMNTSDQNVFTLDTAFQRRWDMRLVENSFDQVDKQFKSHFILDTTVTWEKFCTQINSIILEKNVRMSSSEDKRLGTYFIKEKDLEYDSTPITSQTSNKDKSRIYVNNSRFPEKVIKYLWDDAFKFSREDIFEVDQYNSLEEVIKAFMTEKGNSRFRIFKQEVYDSLVSTDGENLQV